MVKRIIDSSRLKAALRENGYTLGEASVKLGYSKSYLSQASSTGMLPENVVKALQAICEISPEEYLTTEETKDGSAWVWDLIRESKLQTASLKELGEDVDNIRYSLNMVVGILERLCQELLPEEEEKDE